MTLLCATIDQKNQSLVCFTTTILNNQSQPITSSEDENVLELLYQQGLSLKNRLQYKKALEWCQFVYHNSHEILGPNCSLTLNTVRTIAEIYNEQGNHSKSTEWFQKAFKASTTMYGNRHRTTIAVMNDVALSLSMMDLFTEALSWQNRALSLCIHTRGHDDVDTYAIINNLGCIYDRSGRTWEAFVQFSKVMSWRKANLGKNHSDTHAVWNNLAVSFYRQHRFAESLSWYRKAFTAQIKTLGHQHSDTLATMNNMALALSARGSHDEALHLLKESQTRLTSIEHPASQLGCTVLYNYAVVLCRQKQYPEALQIIDSALASHHAERLDFSSLLNFTNMIALSLKRKGDTGNAVHWLRCVIKWQKIERGKTHHTTVIAGIHLAEILQKQGGCEEALKLWNNALRHCEDGVGSHDCSTILILKNIAGILVGQCRLAEALAAYQRVYVGCSVLYGTASEQTLDAIFDLGYVQQHTKNHTLASDNLKLVVEGYKNLLGKKHPKTKSAEALLKM